jgi:hypothetical protein
MIPDTRMVIKANKKPEAISVALSVRDESNVILSLVLDELPELENKLCNC